MTKFFGSVAKRLGSRTVIVAAVALASVASVGGISYALTANTESGPAANSGSFAAAGTPSPSTALGKQVVRGRVARLVHRAVHIDVVVPVAGGGFRTIDFDKGTVSAVSTSSITVDPADGDAPITVAITGSTREPKGAVSDGQSVLLVSSQGNALIIRPKTQTSATGNSGGGLGLGGAAS